ncbi:MAG: steroid delta-isomerase [Betaproteobacteria bacterium]
MYRPPATAPAIVGKEAFAQFYATQQFNHVGLHAQLVDRLVLGSTVIDHERISGIGAQPFEVAVVYEVSAGLIRRTWALAEN